MLTARTKPIVSYLLLLGFGLLGPSMPASADNSFWRSLANKYGDGRPAVGLLNECLDYVTYTGEVQFQDVTKQSGLEATKSSAAFKGSQFRVDTRFHWVCAIIDASRAQEFATVRIPFHSKRTLSEVEARVILRDGTPLDVAGEKISDAPMAPDFPAYSDLGWRTIDFGPLPDSCVIDLKYAVRGGEAFAMNHFPFDHAIPFDRERYVINAPTSVVSGFSWWAESYRADVDLGKPKIETVSGSTGELQRYAWELANVPEIPEEELSVPLAKRARRVDLTVAFERDWSKLLSWYRGEVERVFAEDARGAAQAAEIVRGVEDDSLRARAIFDHVRRRVRPVPIPVNRGALVPDPPSEVLERGYGDAKDIAACLAFLLRAAGIEAHMALVSTSAGGRFETHFPSFLHLDHALVYLVLPMREVWLDATDPVLGFGIVSEALRGGRGDSQTTPLIVWDGGPNFWDVTAMTVGIPTYGLGECGYSTTNSEVVWEPSGSVSFRTTLELHGALSLEFRRALMGKSAPDQSAYFSAWLARAGAADRLVDFAPLNLDSLEQDLRVRYAVGRAWTPGAGEVRLPTRFVGLPYLQEAPADTTRFGAVAFNYPEDIREEARVTPPEGYALASFPADISLNSSFLRFDRKHTEDLGNLQISSSMSLVEPTVAPNQFGGLVRFLARIRELGDEEIVFRKTPLLGKAGE